MKSVEEQEEAVKGFCCAIYLFGFVGAVGAIIIVVIPALVRLL